MLDFSCRMGINIDQRHLLTRGAVDSGLSKSYVAGMLDCRTLFSGLCQFYVQGWLSPNKIYDGVAEPLQQALSSHKAETYIVTTKQVCHG